MNSCVDCIGLLNYVKIMIELFITCLIMMTFIFYVVGSLIWIGCWLSIVYMTIGKSLCKVNWLKSLRNGDDDDWEVMS